MAEDNFNVNQDLEGEVWKDFPETGGCYQVSNFGRVRRYTIMKIVTDPTGSTTVSMCIDGKRICRSVRKAMAEVFPEHRTYNDAARRARERAVLGYKPLPTDDPQPVKPMIDFGLPRRGFPPIQDPRQVELSPKVGALNMEDQEEILDYFMKGVPVEQIAKSFNLHEMDIRVVAYKTYHKRPLITKKPEPSVHNHLGRTK